MLRMLNSILGHLSPMTFPWRSIIPRPHARIDHSYESLPRFLALNIFSFAGLFVLAYLARRPTSRLIRIMLLPPIILTSLYSAFNYRWFNPGQNVFNWFQGVFAFVAIGKALEFALSPRGILKNGETVPGQRSYSSAFVEAGALIINMRGQGLQWSSGVYIPPSTHAQLPPGSFLWRTTIHAIVAILKYDIAETTLKRFPRVGEMDGGLYYSELSLVPRYVVSTFICFLVGTCVLAGVEAAYDITRLIAVGLFRTSPSVWPPALGNPWMATSVQDLWGRQWHQLLRRTFIIYGGYPGQWIAGRVGFVIGTFLASGLFHELSAYAMGYGIEWRPVLFFLIQGILVLGEVLFRRISGKKVQGWAGRIWTYIAIVGLGQPMVDLWLRRGVGVAVIFPTAWSPTRFFLRNFGINLLS